MFPFFLLRPVPCNPGQLAEDQHRMHASHDLAGDAGEYLTAWTFDSSLPLAYATA